MVSRLFKTQIQIGSDFHLRKVLPLSKLSTFYIPNSLVIFLLLSHAIMGCGKGGSGAGTNSNGASLKSLEITPASISIAKGTTCLLTAKGKYSDNTEHDISDAITWVSSKSDIATVSNGLVTGVNEGNVVITVTDPDTGISTSIEVPVARVLAISVTTDDSIIKKGVPQQFKAIGTLSDRRTQDMTAFVNWSSSNPIIAAISDSTNGEVKGVAAGKATITATWNSDSGSSDLTVFDAPILTGRPTFSATAIAAGDTIDVTIPVSNDAYSIAVSLYDSYWNYLGQTSVTNNTGASSVTATITTTTSASNDQMSGPLPIGFDFVYFGTTYKEFQISSNGFITFDLGLTDSYFSAGDIPSSDTPNNLIAFAWTDLYPPGGGTITYETRGIAPNRKMVVNIDNSDWCCTIGEPKVTAQVILYEGSNIIEIHTAELTPGQTYTQGIENADGKEAYFVSGRVASDFGLFNDAVRFYTK